MACRDVWNTWPSGLRSPQNPPASPSGFVVTGGPRAMYFTHHGKPWLKPISAFTEITKSSRFNDRNWNLLPMIITLDFFLLIQSLFISYQLDMLSIQDGKLHSSSCVDIYICAYITYIYNLVYIDKRILDWVTVNGDEKSSLISQKWG